MSYDIYTPYRFSLATVRRTPQIVNARRRSDLSFMYSLLSLGVSRAKKERRAESSKQHAQRCKRKGQEIYDIKNRNYAVLCSEALCTAIQDVCVAVQWLVQRRRANFWKKFDPEVIL